ncbi:uncharacterized protein LOC133865416 [Alnus glutinosa]|uniref:uncharacterized protein LOC133865416 n=1 Tax=Alnus glutinosa TaxID=3517 RepID=UPI002D76F458|nr:uncharacterized protein LOC133865416 [Alnus glutinosa]
MELELGLKITKTRDDLASTADVMIAKDRAGPVFLSKEHDSMFILTAYLRGFRKENIDIKINEDGTRITVSVEKPVQEMVMIDWMVYKKRVELRGFRKVFKIPDGVVLDRIKAKFDEEASLTIVMPKREKGIRRVGIEEVKEEEVERETAKPEREQAVADAVLERDNVGMKLQEESNNPETDGVVKEKVGRGKPEAVQTVADKEPKRERETREPESKITEETQQVAETPEEAQKIEHHRELEGATKHPEVATMKPTTEETWSKELPELSEPTKKRDIPKEEVQEKGLEEEHLHGPERAEPSHTVVDQVSQQPEIPHQPSSHRTEVEEKGTKGEFRQAEHEMPQEPQNQESHTDVRESTKSKPDQEPVQAETLQPERPVENHDKEEVKEREETHVVQNEVVQEASKERSSQEKEGESSEAGKKNDLGEQETRENQSDSKMCKLGAPCVIAGSAFLVSLIVFVIHKIRAKKNE